MAAFCAELSEFTYAVEPRRPSSSAPHQPKGRCRSGWNPVRATARATSRLAAEPEPLALMPGAALTLSRCAPTIRVSVVSPPGQSAIRLYPVAPPELEEWWCG